MCLVYHPYLYPFYSKKEMLGNGWLILTVHVRIYCWYWFY